MDIKRLLDSYRTRFKAPQGVVIAEVVASYEALRLPVTASDFTYNPNTKTITIVAGGPKRMELLLRKNEMFSLLSKRLTPKEIPTRVQ